MNGQPWSEFDAEKLTVTLPPAGEECTVKVRVVSALETFESEVESANGTATITLIGQLDETVAGTLERDLAQGARERTRSRIVLRAEGLESMSSAGARALLFLRQKLPFEDIEVVIVGAKPEVQEACPPRRHRRAVVRVRRRHQEAQAAEVATSRKAGGVRHPPSGRLPRLRRCSS